jgi:hypothetical protein
MGKGLHILAVVLSHLEERIAHALAHPLYDGIIHFAF